VVKNFLKTGNVEGQVIKDDFGHIYRPFRLINKKPILPTAEEVRQNPRARSAKLRVGSKQLASDS
jgi:16S rRNA (cytosine1402-N4)-methyltransferase